MSTIPTLNFPSIKLGNKEWSSGGKASFQQGFNILTFTYNTDISLSYIETRVTKANEETGIGIGNRVYRNMGGISANENHNLSINIDSTNFDKGDGQYTIAFYGKSAIDGTWTETLFFIVVAGLNFVPRNYDNLEVITKQKAPNPDNYVTEEFVRASLSNVRQVPTGGTNGQVLTKTSSDTDNYGWQNINTVPTSGEKDQVLTKTSSGYAWENSVSEFIIEAYSETGPSNHDVLWIDTTNVVLKYYDDSTGEWIPIRGAWS